MSRPQVQKNNRNSIFVFVNGRLIRDRLLLHALSAAYHNLMPPACFPFALLFLECDPGEVDVNVHPSKTEVRFRHGSQVHDFVRDALREQLMLSRPAPSLQSDAAARGGTAVFRVLADDAGGTGAIGCARVCAASHGTAADCASISARRQSAWTRHLRRRFD